MPIPDPTNRIIEPPEFVDRASPLYRWFYDVWSRTGGFNSNITDLEGLQATVDELNTLVGINTELVVQAQLDLKLNTAAAGSMAFQNSDSVTITGGSLADVEIISSTVSGDLNVNIGTSGTTAIPGASLNSNPNEIGNIDAMEDDLSNYTLASHVLGNDGDYVEIDGFGTFAANANNKQIRLYFGGSLIFDTGVLAANAGSWLITGKVMRLVSADQKAISSVISSNALLIPSATFTDVSEDSSSPILIKFTGTGVDPGDILQEGFSVKWFSAT